MNAASDSKVQVEMMLRAFRPAARIGWPSGTHYVGWHETLSAALLMRGRSFSVESLRVAWNSPGRCHWLVRDLLASGDASEHVVGFVHLPLAVGHGWIYHSWGLSPAQTIIETAIPPERVAYWGAVLTQSERDTLYDCIGSGPAIAHFPTSDGWRTS